MTRLTKLIPQVRLQSLILFFICAAIGLTCATAPPTDPDLFLGMYVPQLNLHYAMFYAVVAAMVIGLLQDNLSFLKLRKEHIDSGARLFA